MNTLQSARSSPSAHWLPPMLLLFIGSGCAALIYEIVWFQMLQLVVGVSAVSLAVLLGTFMGGMCAGSLLLPRFVSQSAHPLRVYAALEGLIGVVGAILIGLMPLVGQLYTAVDGGGPSSIVLRAVASIVLLLPPTILMGATLPAISRYVETTPAGIAWLGFFYGGNILGAVVGCLGAGFYLLREFDLTTASLVAVAINGLVAGTSFLLSKRAPYTHVVAPPDERPDETSKPAAPEGLVSVYSAIALSGLTALGAEVVWTRLLSLLFGASTYAFSVILAVFLAGLGIGSALGSAWARTTANARAALGWVQLLLGVAIAYGAWMVSAQIPFWPIYPALAPSEWFNFQIDIARALVAMLPAALLWGASFPLAVAAAAKPGGDAGSTVGRVYAANTLGAIAGSILTGLLGVPLMGTHGVQGVLIAIASISGAIVLVPLFLSRADGEAGGDAESRPVAMSRGAMFVFSAVLLSSCWLAASVHPVPPGLVSWGRLIAWQGTPRALYVGEGINASIAVTEEGNGLRNFHVSGKVEASTEPQDMRLQRLLGHLTALMHEKGPKNALVVGFGAGVTAGAISIHPGLERMVICELEPLIPKVVSTYFSDANHDVVNNPKVEIVYDDARHYVLTTREKFDVITSDPIHPWVKGAATLYTKEYFEHVKAHLNPGGVVTQWVPLYESTEDVVRSEIATFFEVFPNGTVWRNDDLSGRGYDVVLVGRLDATPLNLDAWREKFESPDYEQVKASLTEADFSTVFEILRTYLGRSKDLAPWTAGAAINSDSNLRLQYLAGLGMNNDSGTLIRDAMLRYLQFPEDLFVGDPANVEFLRSRMVEQSGAWLGK